MIQVSTLAIIALSSIDRIAAGTAQVQLGHALWRIGGAVARPTEDELESSEGVDEDADTGSSESQAWPSKRAKAT